MDKKNSKKQNGSGLFLIWLSIIALLLTYIMFNNSGLTVASAIPFTFISLIGGMIFEYSTITKSWKKVMLAIVISYLISFFCFIPGKNEEIYNLKSHIDFWPYWFCILFTLYAIVEYDKNFIPELNEGITMLQSVSFIYWMIDINVFSIHNYFIMALCFTGIILSAFSFFEAFSYKVLSKNIRFILSLWSSMIMLVFSIDYIWSLFKHATISTDNELPVNLYNIIAYFLLGVSSIYIVKNFIMIFGFMPDKGEGLGTEYIKRIKELKQTHIRRFSKNQIKIIHALILMLLTSLIYAINYYINLFPRNFIIWLVFVTFPLLYIGYKMTLQLININIKNESASE